MVKQIAYSFLYFIIWVVISSSIGILAGNSDWLNASILGGIGAFFGTLIGYELGKRDRGWKLAKPPNILGGFVLCK